MEHSAASLPISRYSYVHIDNIGLEIDIHIHRGCFKGKKIGHIKVHLYKGLYYILERRRVGMIHIVSVLCICEDIWKD